jgi:hypothetical protein
MEKNTQQTVFSKDKVALGLAAWSVFATVATILFSLVRLRSHDFKIPVQYIVNDGSVLQTSSWYSLYSLALFSLISTVVILFLAHRLHRSNRLFSLGILLVYGFVSSVGFLVTFALLNLVSQV